MSEEKTAELNEIDATMKSPGFAHIEKYWAWQMSKILKEFRTAKLKSEDGHGPEYWQGRFSGFDDATKIIDLLKREIEDELNETEAKE